MRRDQKSQKGGERYETRICEPGGALVRGVKTRRYWEETGTIRGPMRRYLFKILCIPGPRGDS